MQKFQTLSNGVEIPSLGFGTFQIPDGEVTEKSVAAAIACGYTHIDCAAVYGNESSVGRGIKASGAKREDLFLVSKVWNDRQEYSETLKAFDETLERLQTDYLDLYLVHWPKPLSSECWKAMEKLYADDRVRAIGVSNFTITQMEDLLKTAEVVPMVNQVELHPQFPQKQLKAWCEKKGMLMESWGPLMQGQIFDSPLFAELAEKYGYTVAQLAVKWQQMQDNICLVKSVNPERIKANFDVPVVDLLAEDLKRIEDEMTGERIGADPDNFDF